MAKQNYSKQIEEEIQRQLQSLDHRIDRGGWASLLLIVVLLFAAIYLIVFFVGDDDEHLSHYEQQIVELESRVEILEEYVANQIRDNNDRGVE